MLAIKNPDKVKPPYYCDRKCREDFDKKIREAGDVPLLKKKPPVFGGKKLFFYFFQIVFYFHY
jgi:hypothetical protein